ncbi:coiled-coil domain-containing protein 50-like isoform X3 [Haliotis asinina]|uniref:coiled-coil domain-containing protein 50-like isoform X3 n=1 Tax=Haliotis asinina TaxID=109174 RepID=UPI0035318BDE
MAEARQGSDTLPERGKVQQVCRQWLVHEDGVKAYQMQNEEFDFHYGLNRKNRRTVREDIPVAKVVQSEEEKLMQEERYQQLQALNAQAEEDEKVAQRMKVQLEVEDLQRQKMREVEDQEIARQIQEKEKKKYEKYLEKKKEKQLQKQREKLERQLAQHTEEARLVAADGASLLQLGSAVEDMNLDSGQRGTTANGHSRYRRRVTPAGHIEDDGDFSDFYTVPNDGSINPIEHRAIQELQDEELARLLQDQEHKRTKAEVDRGKLRQIEAQDEQLARVIQEQEKLKARKVKQRRKQLLEQQRQQQMAQEAMASGMNMSAAVESISMQANGESPPGHRYRRDSYTRSISNSNSPAQESQSVHHHAVTKQMSAPPNLPPREPPSYQTHQRIQEERSAGGRYPPSGDIPVDQARDMQRWLDGMSPHHVPSHHRDRRVSQEEHMAPSPSPPGSYHSDDDGSRSFSPDRSMGSSHAVSTPVQFNIAAAIDPTYKRRQQDIHIADQTEVKTQIPLSRSLPLTDESTGTVSTLSRMEEEPGPEGPVINPWQPVQGQKRSTLDKSRKAKRQSQEARPSKKESKGSCKQQ